MPLGGGPVGEPEGGGPWGLPLGGEPAGGAPSTRAGAKATRTRPKVVEKRMLDWVCSDCVGWGIGIYIP